eukprot:4001547-Amphidinium_carterae.1
MATPMPIPVEMVKISEVRLSKFMFAKILIPPTKTIEKHRKVRPPMTQSGIEAMMLPNLAMTPKRINQNEQAKPAA